MDDDPVFLEVLKGSLEHRYEVVVAGSGAAAMEYLSRTLRVDKIIPDIIMKEHCREKRQCSFQSGVRRK